MNDFDGTFVTVEGIDGAGTTTVVNALAEQFDVTKSREPSPHWTGDVVRQSIGEDSDTPPLTDFYSFLADRAMHNEHTLKPALRDGETVVCDRYSDSTRAYQTIVLQESRFFNDDRYTWEFVEENVSKSEITPDFCIFLDADPDESFERVDGDEKYEQEKSFQSRVNGRYREIAQNDRYATVDATRSKQRVVEDCVELFEVFVDNE